MLKIVHIARPVSGVGVYISLLVKHLDSGVFSNVVFCNAKEENIELKNSLGKDVKMYHINLFRRIRPVNDFLTLVRIIKLLKLEKPDIIHCHSAKSGILGRIAGAYLGVKTFYTPHAYSYLSQKTNSKRYFFKFIEKAISILPGLTLACSDSEFKRAKFELNIKDEKLYLWKNSIEKNINLSNIKLRKNLPKQFISTVGRPSYQKNTELLIRAIIELKKLKKDIHLVILGAGLYSPFLNKLKALISENNLELNVTIIPWLPRLETLKVIESSLFYVSTSRYEGLPYALIEALSLGKACIVTNVDGNKDLIKNNENGFVINENEVLCAELMHKLICDNELRNSMSIRSRKVFLEAYCINNNISKLEEIYLS